MALERIKSRLGRLNTLVEGWNGNDISAIERDLALEHLRAIYDELSSVNNNTTVVEASLQPTDRVIAEPEPIEESPLAEDVAAETVAAVQMPPEPHAEEEPARLIDDPIDIDALLGLSSSDEEIVATLLPAVEPERVEEPAAGSEPDGDSLPEPVPESTPEPELEPAPEPEFSIESREPDAAVEEPASQPAKSAMGGLFDISEIPIRSKRRRNVMISLYEEPARPLVASDSPVPAASPTAVVVAQQSVESELPQSVSASEEHVAESADEVESTIAEAELSTEQPDKPEAATEHRSTEQPAQRYTAPVTPTPSRPTRLADVLGDDVTTLADSMIGDKPMVGAAAAMPLDDLRKAIGINDRFLMIRDLFNGDARMFENTITTLNEFDDLDECMIYIVENFAWNPDSDGARLLMELIRRKLA